MHFLGQVKRGGKEKGEEEEGKGKEERKGEEKKMEATAGLEPATLSSVGSRDIQLRYAAALDKDSLQKLAYKYAQIVGR